MVCLGDLFMGYDDTEVGNSLSFSQARPLPDLRDADAPVRQPAHRDLVEPSSRIQTGSESVAAPLIGSDAPNIKVLTYSEPVNSVGDLAIFARLLDSRAKVCVLQSDAVLVAT